MEERLSREAILHQLQTEYDHFQAALAPLSPVQMMEPGAVGYWSVKDVLAHLIFWNTIPVQEIEAAARGETAAEPQGTVDAINARAVAAYRDRSLVETREDFEQSFQAILAVVQTLPDEAFQPDNRIERTLDETIHGVLANNTYEHWPIHEAQIRQWIEQNRKN